jgi:hypothetical protein
VQVAGTYLLSRAAAGDYSKKKEPTVRRTEVVGERVVRGEELQDGKLLRAKAH